MLDAQYIEHEVNIRTLNSELKSIQQNFDTKFNLIQKNSDDKFFAQQLMSNEKFAAMEKRIDDRFSMVDFKINFILVVIVAALAAPTLKLVMEMVK